jgi:hypothetical protein
VGLITAFQCHKHADGTQTLRNMQMVHKHYETCRWYTNITKHADGTQTLRNMQMVHKHNKTCRWHTNITKHADGTQT